MCLSSPSPSLHSDMWHVDKGQHTTSHTATNIPVCKHHFVYTAICEIWVLTQRLVHSKCFKACPRCQVQYRCKIRFNVLNIYLKDNQIDGHLNALKAFLTSHSIVIQFNSYSSTPCLRLNSLVEVECHIIYIYIHIYIFIQIAKHKI